MTSSAVGEDHFKVFKHILRDHMRSIALSGMYAGVGVLSCLLKDCWELKLSVVRLLGLS